MKATVLIVLLVFIGFLCSGQSSSSTGNSLTDVYSVQSCDQLSGSAKTPAEKAALQKGYWALLGILNDLSRYHQLFLKNQKLIDLFPTAYYYTTLSEMQRIVNLKFSYPLEKMDQMIAFYDAYKVNRTAWEQGRKDKVETHWRIHFQLCDISFPNLDRCITAGVVLTSGIRAHIQYDLPRALRYAYEKRITKTVVYKDLLYDFSLTNDLFPQSENLATNDLKQACYNWWIGLGRDKLYYINGLIEKQPGWLARYTTFTRILTNDDMIYLRGQAWIEAFAQKPILNLDGYPLAQQPLTDHMALIAVGRDICPPADDPAYRAPAGLAPVRSAVPVANAKGLTGGLTPESLGRLMLKAVKTNNLDLWISCIHPVVGDEKYISDSFARVREHLEEAGVTDWTSLSFSRVVFDKDITGWGKSDNGIYQAGIHPGDAEYKGEQIRRDFMVEFTYRNGEFIGRMGDIAIMTYHHKNYLMLNASSAFLNRLR